MADPDGAFGVSLLASVRYLEHRRLSPVTPPGQPTAPLPHEDRHLEPQFRSPAPRERRAVSRRIPGGRAVPAGDQDGRRHVPGGGAEGDRLYPPDDPWPEE